MHRAGLDFVTGAGVSPRVEREEREAKRAEYGEAVQCQMQEHQAQLVQEQAACFEDEKHLQKEIQWHADRIGELKKKRMEELQ